MAIVDAKQAYRLEKDRLAQARWLEFQQRRTETSDAKLERARLKARNIEAVLERKNRRKIECQENTEKRAVERAEREERSKLEKEKRDTLRIAKEVEARRLSLLRQEEQFAVKRLRERVSRKRKAASETERTLEREKKRLQKQAKASS